MDCRGESVVVFLAAANRDPEFYPEPARLEARLAISALLERFPHRRLSDESPVWRALPVFRGLAKLRVLVAAP